MSKTFHGWLGAESAAAEWMRDQLGIRDARVTVGGSDAGIDVFSRTALAQVKMEGRPVGRPALQRLVGAAHGSGKDLLFFSVSGFSPQAIAYADQVGMQLFRLDPGGSLHPIGRYAARVLPARGVKESASVPPARRAAKEPAEPAGPFTAKDSLGCGVIIWAVMLLVAWQSAPWSNGAWFAVFLALYGASAFAFSLREHSVVRRRLGLNHGPVQVSDAALAGFLFVGPIAAVLIMSGSRPLLQEPSLTEIVASVGSILIGGALIAGTLWGIGVSAGQKADSDLSTKVGLTFGCGMPVLGFVGVAGLAGIVSGDGAAAGLLLVAAFTAMWAFRRIRSRTVTAGWLAPDDARSEETSSPTIGNPLRQDGADPVREVGD